MRHRLYGSASFCLPILIFIFFFTGPYFCNVFGCVLILIYFLGGGPRSNETWPDFPLSPFLGIEPTTETCRTHGSRLEDTTTDHIFLLEWMFRRKDAVQHQITFEIFALGSQSCPSVFIRKFTAQNLQPQKFEPCIQNTSISFVFDASIWMRRDGLPSETKGFWHPGSSAPAVLSKISVSAGPSCDARILSEPDHTW